MLTSNAMRVLRMLREVEGSGVWLAAAAVRAAGVDNVRDAVYRLRSEGFEIAGRMVVVAGARVTEYRLLSEPPNGAGSRTVCTKCGRVMSKAGACA